MKQVISQLLSLVLIASLFTACNGGNSKAAATQQVKTIDSLNNVLVKQRLIDSMNQVREADSIKAAKGHVVKKNTQVVATEGAMSTTTTQAAKKKGWSHTAKGAVVGAGTGAITGAIVNSKNRGEGAVIGTLIGAGVGAGTGLIVDKSVAKKKKKARKQ